MTRTENYEIHMTEIEFNKLVQLAKLGNESFKKIAPEEYDKNRYNLCKMSNAFINNLFGEIALK
jgi:hypothetical protein